MKVIAGPCQHESLEQSLEIAQHCADVCSKYGAEYIFKASYDKANRTKIDSKRGVGMEQTLTDFATIKQKIKYMNVGIKTLTDVHDYVQVARIVREFNDAVDVLQIPAFLCRQTDLIVAACGTGKIVNIKKGQFLSPQDIIHVLDKTKGAKEVWITERGTQFGYNNVVVDFVGLEYMRQWYDDVVFDLTHACNDSKYVPSLARAGSALGIDNFFLEVHKDPDNAPSDGHAMVNLDEFERIIDDIHCYSYTS
tara:strand:- start:109 stop:861 length:753 start_codon:yes stop_codon:yes gene_type:complete